MCVCVRVCLCVCLCVCVCVCLYGDTYIPGIHLVLDLAAQIITVALGLGDDKPGMSGGGVTDGSVLEDAATSLVGIGSVGGVGHGSWETPKQVDSVTEPPEGHRSDRSNLSMPQAPC